MKALVIYLGMMWRIWKAHGTLVFLRLMAYHLWAMATGRWEMWLRDCIPAGGDVAVDAGASTGQWTLLLASRFRWVIAIEPHPVSAARLRRKVPANVDVIAKALWFRETTIPLVTYPDKRVCRVTDHDLLYSIGHGDGSIPVPAINLDAFNLPALDFLKLDIEGAEWDAIRGGLNTITRFRPAMLIELHSKEAQHKIEQCLEALGYKWQYHHYPFYKRGDELYERRLWVQARP